LLRNISNVVAELGEGIYIHPVNDYIYWVDISKNMLFVGNSSSLDTFSFEKKITTVLFVDDNLVYLTSSRGIEVFNTSTGLMNLVDKTPVLFSSDTFRSNDGVRISDKIYIYGVMNTNTKTTGAVVVSNNNHSYVIDDDIYIPNTFIKLPGTNDLLISDSLMKKIYKFQFSDDWKKLEGKYIWLDLSGEEFTPDGGCITSKDRIFIALWDGFKVLEFNTKGDVLNEFKVPVPRPTNCAFNSKENKLYITSAFEGLSNRKIKKYPLSGSIIAMDITEKNVN